MTYRILKSQTFPGFDAAVAAFAKEMRDWREQEKRATEHDGREDIHPADRWVHRKRPLADQRVMDAVNEHDVADFEIVDDRPELNILKTKKDKFFNDVSIAERSAMDRITPPGKVRIYFLREQDIRAADAAFIQKQSGLLKAASVAVGLTENIESAVEKQRTPSDTAFMADQAERRRKLGLIERAAAQMHSDIEDLTLENIDKWKMPDFSK